MRNGSGLVDGPSGCVPFLTEGIVASRLSTRMIETDN